MAAPPACEVYTWAKAFAEAGPYIAFWLALGVAWGTGNRWGR